MKSTFRTCCEGIATLAFILLGANAIIRYWDTLIDHWELSAMGIILIVMPVVDAITKAIATEEN